MKNDNDEIISGFWVIKLIFVHKIYFIIIFFLFSIGSIIYSLLLPNKYTAVAKILPKSESTADFGNLASLATLAGISIGTQSYEGLFIDIVLSDYLLDKVTEQKLDYNGSKIKIEDFLDIEIDSSKKNLELQKDYKLKQKLREDVIFAYRDEETYMLILSVTLENPKIAAEFANLVVKEFNNFSLEINIQKYKAEREYLENVIEKNSREIKILEDSLLVIRESTQNYSNSFATQLEISRISREIDKKSVLALELFKQYEMLKLKEEKEVPIFQILDFAKEPYKKSSPARSLIVISVVFLGEILALLGLIIKTKFKDLKSLLNQ